MIINKAIVKYFNFSPQLLADEYAIFPNANANANTFPPLDEIQYKNNALYRYFSPRGFLYFFYASPFTPQDALSVSLLPLYVGLPC